MSKWTFARIEAETHRCVAGNPTRSDQRVSFAPFARALTPDDKLAGVLGFVDRDAKLRAKGGGDWTAWYFVDNVIGVHERLPWTRKALEHVLHGVVAESRVLPPEFVARSVARFLAAPGNRDASLDRLIAKAAKSMWPSDDSEGANFKKAAAKLRELLRTRTTRPRANAAAKKTAVEKTPSTGAKKRRPRR